RCCRIWSLHSSPTRRSSDLGVSLKPVESAREAVNPAMEIRLTGDSVPPATITSASPNAMSRPASPIACEPVEQAVTTELLGPLRSEEHTSELQSRVDLVCRL